MKKICLILAIALGTIKLSAQSFFDIPKDSAQALIASLPKENEIKTVAKTRDLPLVVNYSNEFPVPLDQGYTGDCVAFALAHYFTAKAYEKYGWDLSDPSHIFQPKFWYNNIHKPGNNPGIGLSTAINYACRYGGCMLTDFACDPYNDTLMPGKDMYPHALKYRIESYYSWTGSLSVLKNNLTNSPCIGLINFGTYSHCVCLAGYNDTIKVGSDTGAVLYINSYGPGWVGTGNQYSAGGGYGWLPYKSITNCAFFF